MCNITNYRSMKTSLFALAIGAYHFFPLEILDLMHLIPKVENFDKIGQMVVDNQWLQWHPKLMRKFVIKDVGSNGST